MSQMMSSVPSFGLQRPNPQTQKIENTDDVGGLPRKQRKSATQIARYIRDQYEEGLRLRRTHAYSWLKVIAIMRGVHYFTMDRGFFKTIRKKKGEIRAAIPLMDPRFRWELGRLNSNQPGVSAVPKLGMGNMAFYKADRAQALMTDWIDTEDYFTTYDESNQNKLYFGMQAYHWWRDQYRKRVRVKSVPGSELFPIPAGAPNWEEADGIMRVQTVSRSWLEQQDALRPGLTKKMASKAMEKNLSSPDTVGGMGPRSTIGGTMDGATVITVWMKDSEIDQGGQWFFLVEDELFRASGGLDEEGRSNALTSCWNGSEFVHRIPLEPTYYTKKPDDFWGYGFCENLISSQLELNRQVTHILKWSKENRAFNIFDSTAIDITSLQSGESNYVPSQMGGFEGGKIPFLNVPAQAMGPEVGAIVGMFEGFADRSVGYESGILFGRQEGRTEGGPATSLLNDNAHTPLQPTIDREFRAHQKMFPIILDELEQVWPDSKTIAVAGADNLAQEMAIKKEEFPKAHEVTLSPTPMIAGGRNAMIQMLFNLRQLQSDDGKGFELKSREFRKALRMLNVNPPGLEHSDSKERRIHYRIGMLVNDGQKPAALNAMEGQNPEQMAEDHTMAVDMLRAKILEPGYEFYSDAVKGNLLAELDYHLSRIGGPGGQVRPPELFDDDVDAEDALLGERTLQSQEDDLGNFEGQVTFGSAPVGLVQ